VTGEEVICAGRMHAEEVHTDVALVRRLLAGQFPQWADLPLERVVSAGTDNALYRLGDDMVVRLPRIHWAVGGVAKDFRRLPAMAPLLPVAIPVPLAKGEPAEGYPWEWGVYPWLDGARTRPRTACPHRLRQTWRSSSRPCTGSAFRTGRPRFAASRWRRATSPRAP
jgi:aminoglycoside phosphotransferase (APT) family kinase protein